MPVMLERWNDDKMDALDGKVDGLVIELREQRWEMKAELGEQRREMKAELREQRREMKAGFEKVDGRIDRLYQVLIGAAAVVVVAIIGAPHI